MHEKPDAFLYSFGACSTRSQEWKVPLFQAPLSHIRVPTVPTKNAVIMPDSKMNGLPNEYQKCRESIDVSDFLLTKDCPSTFVRSAAPNLLLSDSHQISLTPQVAIRFLSFPLLENLRCQ